MTKHVIEHAFRLATHMAETQCSTDLIVDTLVALVSLCEDDAVRIVDQALLCLIYDRLAAN